MQQFFGDCLFGHSALFGYNAPTSQTDRQTEQTTVR